MENFRVLNEKERASLRVIEREHGVHYSGGSYEVKEDGKIVYHVSFDGVMATYGKCIGPRVKKILGGDLLILSLPGSMKSV